jgi:uncharacterized protein with NRDE domain
MYSRGLGRIMCLIALFHHVFDDAPLVLAANREEEYTRGGEPPALREWGCRVIAGVDPQHGGTWLGINQHGLVVAVTNRIKSSAPAAPRSRGTLVRDLLACSTARDAVALAQRELSTTRYAGCNLLCLDRDGGTVFLAGDWLRAKPLTPGLHVLTAHDLDDPIDARQRHARDWLEHNRPRSSTDAVAKLQSLCAQTGEDGSTPICLRGAIGGTVSSTILVLRGSWQDSALWHAQGPPDRTPYNDISSLLPLLADG